MSATLRKHMHQPAVLVVFAIVVSFVSVTMISTRGLVGVLLPSVLLTGYGLRDRRKISTLASTDALTGLPNRIELDRLASERLRTASTNAPRDPGTTVLLVDFDRFRDINDGLGHRFGDAVLCAAADRIRNCVTCPDSVARVGGDEFAVLLWSGGTRAGELLAQQIRASLSAPFINDTVEVALDVSIGIATTDRERLSTPDALMRAADLALHAAKVQGGGHVVYTPALGNEVADRVRIVDEVRRAIDNDELVLHYQPQVALDSGRLVSVEALLRWQHPERGLIAPGEFLSAVEDHVIINRITSVVLHKALSQIKVWQAQGRSIPVSVNVASRSLMNVGFPAEVAALLDEYGVEPQLLCLELTETTVMQDPARCGRTLQALHGLGVRLSMDDYGTGYASIAHLKNLPLDELKVDRSFVSRMMHDAQYRVLTESIVDLGHNLGLTVVAEGVEDADASYALSAFGCDLAQGYLYCRPVAPDEIPNWQAPGASAAVHAAIPAQRAPQMCPTLEPVDHRRAADSLTLHYGQLRYQAG